MRHPDPYKRIITLTYFKRNKKFAKLVISKLERAKDECSSWWVKVPAFMKYPTLWRNGYTAKKAINKPKISKRKICR